LTRALVILLLGVATAAAGPRWMPITAGRFLDTTAELARIDAELAKQDKRVSDLLQRIEGLAPGPLAVAGHAADALVEETGARLDDARRDRDAAGSFDLGGVLGSLASGNYLAAIMALLGAGGTAHQAAKRKRAEGSAQTYRGKALAHMSPEAAKADPDFPEVV